MGDRSNITEWTEAVRVARVSKVRVAVEVVEPVHVDAAGYPITLGLSLCGTLVFLDPGGRAVAAVPVTYRIVCLTRLRRGQSCVPDDIHIDSGQIPWFMSLLAEDGAWHTVAVDSVALCDSITTALAELNTWTLLNLYTTRIGADSGDTA